MNYKEAVAWLESLPNLDHPPLVRNSRPHMTPESCRAFLTTLGIDPDGKNKKRPTGLVHITGSKGKGSTTTMLSTVLNELDGPSAHFISPHLRSHTERINLASNEIKEEEFAAAVSRLKKKIESLDQESDRWSEPGSISLFYALIAMFLSLSGEEDEKRWHKWRVMEVGLGGLKDATNIFEKKELCIFTPIHLEHRSFLGKDLKAITQNKAGIIKEKSRVLVAKQVFEPVVSWLKKRTEEMGGEFLVVEDHYRMEKMQVHGDRQSFVLNGPSGKQEFWTRMIGEHQVINATTTIAAVDFLNVKNSTTEGTSSRTELINKAFMSARLPGRFEVLKREPLLIADGAHTGSSARLLKKFILEHYSYQDLHLILALGADKEVVSILEALLPGAKRITVTSTGKHNSLSAMELAKKIKESQPQSPDPVAIENIDEALCLALDTARKDDLVLVTGSLYAAVEASSIFKQIFEGD